MPNRTFVGLALALVVIAVGLPAPASAQSSAGYDDLVGLFADFRDARSPAVWSAAFDDADAPYGVADWSASAAAERIARIDEIENRLRAIDHTEWSVAEKADWLAVKAQIAAERFHLEVSRPWSRDPGTYVDPLLRALLRRICPGARRRWPEPGSASRRCRTSSRRPRRTSPREPRIFSRSRDSTCATRMGSDTATPTARSRRPG